MSASPQHPVLIGISLSATWIPGLERAVELLRARHPGICDAEVLERIAINGICATIETHAPRSLAPFAERLSS